MTPALPNRTSKSFAQPHCVARPCAHGLGREGFGFDGPDSNGPDANGRIRQR